MTLGLAPLAGLGRALVLGLILAAGPALGQTIAAQSGEHEGFTRIVLDYGTKVDWTVGRQPDGYALRLNEAKPNYDLTGVFSRIGKTRLGAIWADPETGDLVFSANCACHAIAFEFRPGIVVIDLKDGPPPSGSGFEVELDGPDDFAVPVTPTPEPSREPNSASVALPEFDWTRPLLMSANSVRPQDIVGPEPLKAPAPDLEKTEVPSTRTDPAMVAFEDDLRAELAAAASGGIVDLAKPKESDQTVSGLNDGVLDQFRIGRKGEATLGQDTTRQANLGNSGDICVPNESLAIYAWGAPEKPVADQIADMRGGLVGEFDAVDAEKLTSAIRFHLYLGFGTEVQDLIEAFAPNDPEVALWSAMALVLEAEPESAGFFAPMIGCQGPAALWALLARSEKPTAGFDRKPVLLAFSDLPVHLRRHLGPRLVDRFLEMGDDEGARILSEAIFRPGTSDAAGIDLMRAKISLGKGNLAETETILRERIAAAGPDQTEAYFSLVELLVAQRRSMMPNEAVAIAALVEEQADAAQAQRLLTLAQAASGDFQTAFAGGNPAADIAVDLWGLLATIGQDDDLLRHAVLAETDQPAQVQPTEAIRISERLLELGLPKQSARWQVWAGNEVDAPAHNLLLARTELALGMTTEVLARVGAVAKDNDLARELAAEAYAIAGDDLGQAGVLDPTDPRLAFALGRGGDWRRLAQSGDGPWSALAQEMVEALPDGSGDQPAAAPVAGPLARSAKLVETSSQTRNRIQALLAIAAKPEG